MGNINLSMDDKLFKNHPTHSMKIINSCNKVAIDVPPSSLIDSITNPNVKIIEG